MKTNNEKNCATSEGDLTAMLDRQISAACKRLGKKNTPELWSEYGVPSKTNYHSIEEKRGLCEWLLNTDRLQKDTKQKQKDTTQKKAHQIVSLIQGIDGLERSSEVKQFLLLVLSKEFTTDIQLLRRELGIPDDGFAKNEDVAEWGAFKILPLPEDCARYVAYGWIEENMDKSVFKKVGVFTHEIETLMGKYHLRVSEYVSAIYMLHGLQNHKLLQEYLTKQAENNKMFALTPKSISFLKQDGWEHKANELTEYGRAYAPYYPNLQSTDEFFICFRIFRSDIKRTDFGKFFSESFEQIEEELQEFMAAPVKSAGGFGYHWLTYCLNKRLDMKRSEINKLFAISGFDQLTTNNLKAINRRMRADIAEVEGYKQVV